MMNNIQTEISWSVLIYNKEINDRDPNLDDVVVIISSLLSSLLL